MKQNNLLLLVFFLLSGITAWTQSNPVAKFYKDSTLGYPSWTDGIKWDNKINMATYDYSACGSCTNDFAKFEYVRDILYSQGGGVMYYPAGTYDFSDIPYQKKDGTDTVSGRGLMLKSGVVIMGEEPTDPTAVDGTLNLTTKFQFPYRTLTGYTCNGKSISPQVPTQWNYIGIMPSAGERLRDVKNVGVCWVNMDGGIIYFGAEYIWGSDYANSTSWHGPKAKAPWSGRVPDGTYFHDPFCGAIDSGRCYGGGPGRLVFGCQLDNATPIHNFIAEKRKVGTYYDPNPNLIFPYQWIGRIIVYSSNVLVANNIISKPTKSFKYDTWVYYKKKAAPYDSPPANYLYLDGNYTAIAPDSIMFDYGRCIGIDVNKSLMGTASTYRKNLDSSAYYQDNIMIWDNWVYNHGNKSMEIAGEWVIIKNNKANRNTLHQNDDVYGLGSGYRLTFGTGWDVVYETDDPMSRGYDMGGKSIWLDHNWFERTGSHPGNDGEGILCQRHNDVEIMSWAFTYNRYDQNGGDGSCIGGWDVHNLGHLNFKNSIPSGFVGHANAAATGNHIMAMSVVDNVSSSVKLEGNVFIDDPVDFCPFDIPGQPVATVSFDTANYRVKIEWTDPDTNEIGYRIERRVVGATDWHVVAYRPMQGKGTLSTDLGYTGLGNPNAPVWYDYTREYGSTQVEYRVVAIDCNDDDAGASDPDTVDIPTFNQDITAKASSNNKLTVYPTPANNSITVSIETASDKNITISIFNIQGETVKVITNAAKVSTVDVSGLTPGVYLVKVSQEGESNVAGKLVKK